MKFESFQAYLDKTKNLKQGKDIQIDVVLFYDAISGIQSTKNVIYH